MGDGWCESYTYHYDITPAPHPPPCSTPPRLNLAPTGTLSEDAPSGPGLPRNHPPPSRRDRPPRAISAPAGLPPPVLHAHPGERAHDGPAAAQAAFARPPRTMRPIHPPLHYLALPPRRPRATWGPEPKEDRPNQSRSRGTGHRGGEDASPRDHTPLPEPRRRAGAWPTATTALPRLRETAAAAAARRQQTARRNVKTMAAPPRGGLRPACDLHLAPRCFFEVWSLAWVAKRRRESIGAATRKE